MQAETSAVSPAQSSIPSSSTSRVKQHHPVQSSFMLRCSS